MGKSKRNPGWFRRGHDPRRCRRKFTREECSRGWWAALEACAAKEISPEWLYGKVRESYPPSKRYPHHKGDSGEETIPF